MPGGQHIEFRNHPVLENLLLMIDIVQKQIQGGDALGQAALQKLPFLGGNDPGDHVERKNLLRPGRIAINVKGDALPQKCGVHRLPLGVIFRRADGFEQLVKLLVMPPHPLVRIQHFVESTVEQIILQHIKTVVFWTRCSFLYKGNSSHRSGGRQRLTMKHPASQRFSRILRNPAAVIAGPRQHLN